MPDLGLQKSVDIKSPSHLDRGLNQNAGLISKNDPGQRSGISLPSKQATDVRFGSCVDVYGPRPIATG